MDTKKLIIYAIIGYLLYKHFSEKKVTPQLEGTGFGAYGVPRGGRPKTERERMETHMRLHGTSELPPRGTGLRRRGII